MRHLLAREQEFTFLGAKLGYRVLGSGPPLLLMHGSFVARPWSNFDQRLAEHFTVYALDLPGFGSSDIVADRVHNISLFAEAIGAFTKSLHISAAPILAHSYGGIMVLKAAVEKKVTGPLILLGLPGRSTGNIARFSSWVPRFLRRRILRSRIGRTVFILGGLRQTTYTKGENPHLDDVPLLLKFSYNDERAMADPRYYHDVQSEVRRLLRRVKNPIHLLYGADDPLKGSLDDVLPKYQIIPGARHTPYQHAQQATLDAVTAILEQYTV